MIRISEIQDALTGLVGWKQSTNPDFDIVGAANLVSTSGRYYQDFSPLVTIENLHSSQNDAAISEANFNLLLTSITKRSISKSLLQIFDDQDFIENKLLYPEANVWTDVIPNDSSFVGYELKIPRRTDLATVLNKVFTSFDADDTVKLLLFHSSKIEPIETKEISVEELNETETALNWDLSSNQYAGGRYYIGYLTSGLTAQATDRVWDAAGVRSSFCTVGIRPIKVSGWDAEELFDLDDIEYTAETYGLNFDISTWKDYSNVIISNKSKFTELIGLQVAAEVLDIILKSTRSNRNERLMNQNALLERDGILSINKDTQRVDAIIPKLMREIKRLKTNFIDTPEIKRATLW